MIMLRHPPLFDGDNGTILERRAGHLLVAGRSGMGKTKIGELFLRERFRDFSWGVHVIDPDSDLSAASLEFLASPGAPHRIVHHLRPASLNAFALPTLAVADRHPQRCHEKTVRLMRILAESIGFDDGELGPRLYKLGYLGLLGLALTGRAVVELPELFSRGAKYVREVIAAAYPFPFLAAAMTSLDLLNDKTFAEFTDPLISRLLPILGNPQLRRVFGPQKPLDIDRVLAARECVLLDLGGLEHVDARLVGNTYASLFYHTAMQREPNVGAPATLLVDEAFDYLRPLARGFDKLRKRHVQLAVFIQRFSQLSKATEDDAVAMLEAALTNKTTQVFYGGLSPDDCDLVVRLIHAGSVNLQEWKDGSARPTAVGNVKELLRSYSRAVHEAEHEMHSITRSHTHGVADGTMTSTGSAAGSFSADGASSGLVMQAPAQLLGPNQPIAQMMPVPLTQSSGDSSSRGSSEIDSTSTGESHTEIEMFGTAESVGRGRSRGVSETDGFSEGYRTEYQSLETQMWSLPEQLFRLAGELHNLDRQECIVKIGGAAPFKTRTTTVQPAFRSHFAKRVMLPVFLEAIRKRSPYIQAADIVDADIKARVDAITKPPAKPEPDFSKPEPSPAPVVDAPEKFASDFWARRPTLPPSPPTKPKPKKRPGRKPVGELPRGADRFTVIDGDGGDKSKKD
jgi:hypothetical protein